MSIKREVTPEKGKSDFSLEPSEKEYLMEGLLDAEKKYKFVIRQLEESGVDKKTVMDFIVLNKLYNIAESYLFLNENIFDNSQYAFYYSTINYLRGDYNRSIEIINCFISNDGNVFSDKESFLRLLRGCYLKLLDRKKADAITKLIKEEVRRNF